MMKPTSNIERLIKQNRFKATPETYKQTLQSALLAMEKCSPQELGVMNSNIWRMIMYKPITKLSLAAIVIVAVCASIPLLDNGVNSVYAIDQTIAAIQTIRTLHMRATDDKNGIDKKDYQESWIKYDATGRMTNLRVNVYEGLLNEGSEAQYFAVWNNGVEKIWRPLQNQLFISLVSHYKSNNCNCL